MQREINRSSSSPVTTWEPQMTDFSTQHLNTAIAGLMKTINGIAGDEAIYPAAVGINGEQLIQLQEELTNQLTFIEEQAGYFIAAYKAMNDHTLQETLQLHKKYATDMEQEIEKLNRRLADNEVRYKELLDASRASVLRSGELERENELLKDKLGEMEKQQVRQHSYVCGIEMQLHNTDKTVAAKLDQLNETLLEETVRLERILNEMEESDGISMQPMEAIAEKFRTVSLNIRPHTPLDQLNETTSWLVRWLEHSRMISPGLSLKTLEDIVYEFHRVSLNIRPRTTLDHLNETISWLERTLEYIDDEPDFASIQSLMTIVEEFQTVSANIRKEAEEATKLR